MVWQGGKSPTSADEQLAGLKGHNSQIEALRGLAALTVAAFHVANLPYIIGGKDAAKIGFDGDPNSPIWSGLLYLYSFLLNGDGAVILFFVISGLVLKLSLDRMQGPTSRIVTIFVFRRLLRLWPPVVLMTLIFWLVLVYSGYSISGSTAPDYLPLPLLQHIFLLDFKYNGAVWTLQVEAIAAFLIPLVWLVARRWGVASLWAMAVMLFVASLGDKIFADYVSQGFAFTNVFHFFYAFVAGMLIPAWAGFVKQLGVPERFAAAYPILGILMIILAPKFLPHDFHLRVLMEVLGSTTLLTGVALSMNKTLGKILDLPLVRFYGRISYSFYLMHPLGLLIVLSTREIYGDLVVAGVPKLPMAFFLFLTTVIAVTPLAMLSYRLIELPSMKMARRIGSPRDPAMTSQTTKIGLKSV